MHVQPSQHEEARTNLILLIAKSFINKLTPQCSQFNLPLTRLLLFKQFLFHRMILLFYLNPSHICVHREKKV